MKVNELVNIPKSRRILNIAKGALHERIKAGYFGTKKVGTILVDPETAISRSVDQLKKILIRPKARQPVQNGNCNNRQEVLNFWVMDSYMEFLKELDFC